MTPEEQRKTDAGRASKRAEDTIGVIMATYEGRWWMADLLDYCHPVGSRYRGDVSAMLVADGRADVGSLLLVQIEEHAPDLYARMMRERRTRIEKAREKAEEQRKAAESTDTPIDETPAEVMLDQQEAFYAAQAAQAEKPRGQ